MNARAALSARVGGAVLALAGGGAALSVWATGGAWSAWASLGAAVTAAIVARAVSRDAAQRVLLLERALSRAGEGDEGVRVRPRGGDEAAAALEAFNAMMDRVDVMRARTEELERIGAWQEFARRLAHEIKNPLTPIQLAVQEVARKYPGGDPVFAKTLETAREIVEEEVESLRRLVTAFSEFARLPEVKLVRGDLAEFVRDAGEGRALVREADGAEVAWDAGEGAVSVRIDRIMLRRAVDNLVRNAVQAGATRVTVRVERSGLSRGEAQLVVEDNGPGVAPAARERVFEPYFTTRSEGTGLGLAIVRKIALDHDGDVVLDAAHEGGARFVLALPLCDEGREGAKTFVTLRAEGRPRPAPPR